MKEFKDCQFIICIDTTLNSSESMLQLISHNIAIPMPVCCVNVDFDETSEGQLKCVCSNGYTGDGVTSCTGQFIIIYTDKHNAAKLYVT